MQEHELKLQGTAESVAVISIDSPPVNSLGHAARVALAEQIQAAHADAKVKAMVLIGSGKMFSAGADIREFNTPNVWKSPDLSELIALIEGGPKPVVAAIHGMAMGGGLELALGCHARVATRDAMLALPEVKLGLLPGAGGTQRLPRLAGLQCALDMIVSGNPKKAIALEGTGLLDSVVSDEGALLPTSIALAEHMGEKGHRPTARARKVVAEGAEEMFATARADVAKRAPRQPAKRRCIDAVEASVKLSFDAALDRELLFFHELADSSESRALRHLFFAERSASVVADLPKDTPVRPIALTAVVGAGTMGSGITQCLLDAGFPVKLLEANQAALDRGVALITANYQRACDKGRLDAKRMAERLSRLTPVLDYTELGDADIVIEAVFEQFDVKSTVFRALDAAMKPGAILATNTSMLDIDKLAATISRPGDVIGTHFFSPAHVMRLLEVVRGAQTKPDVLLTVMRLGKKLGKTAVVARVCDGFIGNRMIEQYLRQAGFLLEEGATPAQVDRAVEAFGLAMGPFRMSDMAGNDVGYDIRQRRRLETPSLFYSKVPDILVEQLGRKGQKVGRGWYDYQAGSYQAIPSAEVEEMIERFRADHNLQARKITDEEIVKRLMYALVNEGYRILDDGIAQRASDIDLAYATGYGFPDTRGGPMFYAEEVGLQSVLDDMAEFARNPQADPSFWQPAAGLLAHAARI
jgi:3-hydroxyacyl-CoA dehydrogenase